MVIAPALFPPSGLPRLSEGFCATKLILRHFSFHFCEEWQEFWWHFTLCADHFGDIAITQYFSGLWAFYVSLSTVFLSLCSSWKVSLKKTYVFFVIFILSYLISLKQFRNGIVSMISSSSCLFSYVERILITAC